MPTLEERIELAAKALYEAQPDSGYIAETDGWGEITKYCEWRTEYPQTVWETAWVEPMRKALAAFDPRLFEIHRGYPVDQDLETTQTRRSSHLTK